MQAPSRTTVLATIGTLLVGVSAYAVYFDYKRRNDPDFRRLLRRDQKRLAQQRKDSAEQSKLSSRKALKAAHQRATAVRLPTSPEEREAMFMQEITKGETLFTAGESMKYEAGICFYKGLKVYPQPEELLRIFEATIPPVCARFSAPKS